MSLSNRDDLPLLIGIGAIALMTVAMIPLACQEEQNTKLTSAEQKELTDFAAKHDSNGIKIVDPLNHELHDLDTPEGRGSLKLLAEMVASDAGDAVMSIQNNGVSSPYPILPSDAGSTPIGHVFDTSHATQRSGAKAWVLYANDTFIPERAYVKAKPEGHGAADVDCIYLVQPDGGTANVEFTDAGWVAHGLAAEAKPAPTTLPGVTYYGDIFLRIEQDSPIRGVMLPQPDGGMAAVSRGGNAKLTGNRWFSVDLKP